VPGSAPVGGEESGMHRTVYQQADYPGFGHSDAPDRLRHVGASPVSQTYDPDLWTDELAFLGRPGQTDIQIDLFYDYRTNVASYPAWQQ
jgi:hypothetical protein